MSRPAQWFKTQWLKTALTEIWGLFVDDGVFAVCIVVWLAVIGTLARVQPAFHSWYGPLLFVGLAIVLIESLLRYARHR